MDYYGYHAVLCSLDSSMTAPAFSAFIVTAATEQCVHATSHCHYTGPSGILLVSTCSHVLLTQILSAHTSELYRQKWRSTGSGVDVGQSSPFPWQMQMVLKCADIGHLVAASHTHRRWAFQLEEEFFRQVLPSRCLSGSAHMTSTYAQL